jgi:peroxiredoxin
MNKIQEPNKPAIDFTLPDGGRKQVKLSDYRGKNVVLAFYPADWSPVCTSEMTLIQETLDEIHGYNAEVVGVSVDSVYSHRAWAKDRHLTFPLLSDFWPHGDIARQYGVFREGDGISERALFFIDESGVIRDTWISEDPALSPGLNVIFNSLEEMQGARSKEARHVG